jgi:hypothetical protein
MTLRIWFLAMLSTTGCGSDSTFSSLLVEDDPVGGSTGGSVRPSNVGPHPGNNNGGGGLWGNLDPGALPEVYFAVAYSTVPYGSYYCDYCDADPEWWYPYGDVRYAVIDLRGQVVWDVPTLTANGSFEHLDLAAAGPGQFSVTARPWYNYDDGADADGWYAGTNWEAYRLDASAMTSTRIAHFDLERWVTAIDTTATEVDLGPVDGTLHLGMFPSDPERALFLGTDTYNCQASPLGIRDLRAVHLSDPEAGALSYAAASMVPDPTKHWWGWDFEASVDEDGAPAALIGATPWDCYALSGNPQVAMWTPTDGLRWTADLGAGVWPQAVTFDARDGGGALSFSYDPVDGTPSWRVSDADGRRVGALGDELYNHRPGPLLEHTSSTFVDVGTRPDDGYDVIEIRHEGRVVWRIDDLRFGVGHQPVSIQDIVLLPM